MSILYWALNDALIQKRKRVAQMKEDDNEGYLKEMIIELQDDADWIRTIQMQIPAAAIKV